MVCLLRLLLLFSLLKDEEYITFARQTPSRRVSASNVSATLPFIQAHSSSSASASRSTINNYTHAIAGATAASINSETCAVKDLYCSSKTKNETITKANATSIDDPCLLWDPSCSGNRTLAIDTFFDPTFQRDLLGNKCFVQAGSINLANTSNCDKYNPSSRISEFQEMKSWMRSKQCALAGTDWTTSHESGYGLDPSSQEAIAMDPNEYHIVKGANPSCCGACETNVENVDVYYWPEHDVNTSCLSIIGDSVKPIDSGATRTVWSVGTDATTETYWGCKPKPSTYYNALLSESVTDTEPVRTAMIRTIGTLLVKVYLSDPWSPSPCTESDITSQGSNTIAQIRDRHATMHARGHTLIIPPSVTHNGHLPVTTVVSGNYNF